MGSKLNPSKFDCYANAEPDEPMFVLLGRDPHAADLVVEWAIERVQAIRNGDKPVSDQAMVNEAMRCAEEMRIFAWGWAARKRGEAVTT